MSKVRDWLVAAGVLLLGRGRVPARAAAAAPRRAPCTERRLRAPRRAAAPRRRRERARVPVPVRVRRRLAHAVARALARPRVRVPRSRDARAREARRRDRGARGALPAVGTAVRAGGPRAARRGVRRLDLSRAPARARGRRSARRARPRPRRARGLARAGARRRFVLQGRPGGAGVGSSTSTGRPLRADDIEQKVFYTAYPRGR